MATLSAEVSPPRGRRAAGGGGAKSECTGGAGPAMETWANGAELLVDSRGIGDATQRRREQQAVAGPGAQGMGRAKGGDFAGGGLRCARACPAPREGGAHGGPAHAPRLRRSAQLRRPPPLVKWTRGSQPPETSGNSGAERPTGRGGQEAQVTKWAGATPVSGRAAPRGLSICLAGEPGKIRES